MKERREKEMKKATRSVLERVGLALKSISREQEDQEDVDVEEFLDHHGPLVNPAITEELPVPKTTSLGEAEHGESNEE